MIDLQDGWHLDVDQGPEWIFFRLVCDQPRKPDEPRIAEVIVGTAHAADIKRVVMEFGEGVMLFSALIGQLVQLHKRFVLEGGAFRLCGLSRENAEALRLLHLGDRLPSYPDREAAVMGHL